MEIRLWRNLKLKREMLNSPRKSKREVRHLIVSEAGRGISITRNMCGR